jgi:hypothetical protein
MFARRFHWLAALSLPREESACLASRSNTLSVAETCFALSQQFPHFTLFPNETLFEAINEGKVEHEKPLDHAGMHHNATVFWPEEHGADK